jgi:7-cyano-7-deazaguanine synthase
MGLVALVSGGLDSTLMTVLAKESGLRPYPLFIDYGQRSAEKEWTTCLAQMRGHGLPEPVRMDLSGYGRVIPSGLTSDQLRLDEDAFLPGRNLLLLVAGGAYAYRVRANAVAIGLLDETAHLFPDQTAAFLREAETAIEAALGYRVAVLAPLLSISKSEVLSLVRIRGITGTYSCHAGSDDPCGRCISCQEISAALHREG